MQINLSFIDDKNFKEDAVREEIINPLLKELGFVFELTKKETLSFATSIQLKTDTVIGSNLKIEKSKILIPDYTLFVNGKPICVLEAKKPTENITDGKNTQQAFYYAINPDVKATYYALCNGRTFNLFAVNGQELLLEVDLKNEFKDKFEELKKILTNSLENFYEKSKITIKDDEWYLHKQLPNAIKPHKRKAKRHFGCLAYFTRQSWDIVQNHILNFTQKGDVVLDSFGGSGVSAVEAMMKGRIGIHIDLNPFSVFMVNALSARVNLSELYETGERILKNFEKLAPKNEEEAKEILKNASYYPSDINAKNSIGGGGIKKPLDS